MKKRWCLKSGGDFDYVFNLASETKYDQPSAIYEERIVDIARVVIAEAKNHPGLKRIFDISTAQVYSHGSKPSKEDSSKLKPWTGIAEAKLKVEALWKESNLPYVLLRPAIVYGPGDQNGLSMFPFTVSFYIPILYLNYHSSYIFLIIK